MWLPSRYARILALGSALLAGALISSCTISPVYGPDDARISLARGSVDSRLEQVAYRTLEQRLTFSDDTEALRLEISVSVSSRTFGLSRENHPLSERELLATITYRVVESEGATIATGTRTGRATYTTSPQAVANDAALNAARERAVSAAAEAVRLVLLAQFGAP